MRCPVALAVVVLSTLSVSEAPAPLYATDPHTLVVHEWGTFTSVAGRDGKAEVWLPLSGEDDLPCFVDRIAFGIKPNLSGTIRMETPVLYFYAPTEMSAQVSVRFKQGAITEWYPHAAVTPTQLDSTTDLGGLESTATWPNVLIRPGYTPVYPHERGESHYYAARATDAVPVQVNGQDEKFLFYRGVGGFQPPLSAAITSDGRVHVEARQAAPLVTSCSSTIRMATFVTASHTAAGLVQRWTRRQQRVACRRSTRGSNVCSLRMASTSAKRARWSTPGRIRGSNLACA